MLEVTVSYEDGRAEVLVEGSVTDEELLEAVKKASGRFRGKVLARDPAPSEEP